MPVANALKFCFVAVGWGFKQIVFELGGLNPKGARRYWLEKKEQRACPNRLAGKFWNEHNAVQLR